MSRLDTFLLSNNLIYNWKIVGQSVRLRDNSDHCPIWIKVSNFNWGPKSFKFKSYWLNHKDFLIFVNNEWSSLDVSGKCDFVLKGKFYFLKGRLRWWNLESFGWMDLQVENSVNDLNHLDKELPNIMGDVNLDIYCKIWEAVNNLL